MHPRLSADPLLLRGVQTLGGVPALASLASGRRTTTWPRPFLIATRDPSPMGRRR